MRVCGFRVRDLRVLRLGISSLPGHRRKASTVVEAVDGWDSKRRGRHQGGGGQPMGRVGAVA